MPEGDETAAGASPPNRRTLVAPWYGAYLILGLINSGLLPFLLPLVVAGHGGGVGNVAYVVGAYYAGLLPAPLLGVLVERRRLFRLVFFGGFATLAIGLAGLPAARPADASAALASLMGLGAGAVATVAPLFIIDFAPKSEWEPRIGWLQSFNGAGQLVGLLLGGVIAEGPLARGFWLAAAFALAALAIGRVGLPVKGGRRAERSRHAIRRPRLDWAGLMRAFQPGPGGGLLQHSHHLQRAALAWVPDVLGGRFGRFLLAWFAWNFGVAPFFAYYPLLMQESFGVAPATTAFLYALGAAISIGLFVLAGWAARRYGGPQIFRTGLAVRTGGFVLLLLLQTGLIIIPGAAVVAPAGFLLVVLAWPLLSVSGTGLAAGLTPIGEGAAMGLLSASGALATVLGTFLGGPLVQGFGFAAVFPLALAGLAGAAALMVGGAGPDTAAAGAGEKGPADAGPVEETGRGFGQTTAAMILSASASPKTLTVVVRKFPFEARDRTNPAIASSLAASAWTMRSYAPNAI
ncbi:MAG: MFS transporter [Rhodospirillales bacterium]|nr:MFS transporter [Rhodospirillales bacterium]